VRCNLLRCCAVFGSALQCLRSDAAAAPKCTCFACSLCDLVWAGSTERVYVSIRNLSLWTGRNGRSKVGKWGESGYEWMDNVCHTCNCIHAPEHTYSQMCCSVLQCVAVCFSVLQQSNAVCCSAMQWGAVCWSVLRCVSMCHVTHVNKWQAWATVCTYMSTHAHTHTHSHTHTCADCTHTYTYKHMYLHTYTRTC